MGRIWLILAGCASFFASLLHVAIIFRGGDWYRMFGAGEQMAQLAEKGSIYPVIVTGLVALGLFIGALYAFAASHVFSRLPFQKSVLYGLTAVFLIRGVMGLVLVIGAEFYVPASNSPLFWLVSSAICIMLGTSYLLGTRWHSKDIRAFQFA